MAMRAATGIAVAMALSMLIDPLPSAALLLGAWSAGITLLIPEVRPRPSLPLLAGLAIGIAVWLGHIAGFHPIATVAIATVWALLMAFVGSLSSAVSSVASVCGVALVLAPGLTVSSTGLVAAGAAVAGGAIQAVAALLPPWSRHRPERHALAASYHELARYSRGLAISLTTPLPTQSLLDTDATLGERRRVPEPLREATSQLYDLRAAIIAVGVARARLQDDDPIAARRTARVLRDTADTLETLAEAVQAQNKIPRDWEEQLAAAIDAGPSDESGVLTTRHTVAGQEIRRLQRSLHRTARFAERVTEGSPATTVVSRRVRVRSRLFEDLETLRANVNWRSPSARHALRAAAIIAITTALSFLLPGTHAYWLPLTAWIVLRADFAATVSRGIERTLGTTAGVLLGSAVSLVLVDRPAWSSVVITLFAIVAYLTMPVSYFVFSLVVAGFVVFQVNLLFHEPFEVGWQRGFTTFAGGLLAIGLYWLLPTWQTRRLPDLMADLIEAYRSYAALVLEFQARPAERNEHELRAAVDEARLRRSELTAAIDQAAVEPIGGPRPYSTDVQDLEAAMERGIRALIVMEGGVQPGDAAQLAGIDEFAEAIDGAYAALADWVRTGEFQPAADLDAALEELDLALGAGSPATRRRRRLLDWESDILVESLDDARLIVSEWNRDSEGDGRPQSRLCHTWGDTG